MPLQILRNKWALAVIALVIIMFVAWFSWMSVMTSKTKFMTSRVEDGLNVGLQIVERDAPRIQYTNNGGYYVPNVDAILPSMVPAWAEVYNMLLENLNQDLGTPLCKVSQVTLWGSSTEIEAYATVQFEVVPGIKKSMTVIKKVPMPHYKEATGDTLIN